MTDEQSQELYYQAPCKSLCQFLIASIMALTQHHSCTVPLYGVGFSRSPNHPARAAVTSFIPTSSNNKLQIVDRLPSQGDHAASQEGNNHHFVPLATASHPFPPSRVTWEPNPAASRLTSRGEHEASTELLATTGDALRIWQATDGSGSDQDDDGYDQVAKSKSNKTRIELRERSKLTNVSRVSLPFQSRQFDMPMLKDNATGQGTCASSPSVDLVFMVGTLAKLDCHLVY